ncbi:hypothetical protein F4604DRAFT_1939614 [Suillus subluteus]|nr:hypothetical protein F4604DRAFT_1939614 [Suillus subluteus]
MQLLLPGPTPESFSNDHDDDNSSLPPVDPLAYQSQPFSDQRQQWDYAQNHNDWEALLRSTSTWSPYNHDVPGNHSFADPNFSFDSNSYTSSQGPEPSTSYSESDSVTHQAPSGMLGSQTIEAPAADSFSVDPYQGQSLQQQWDAQSRDDLEALVLRFANFSGTQHLVLALDVAPGPSRSVTITLPSDSNLDVGPSPSRSATVTPVPPPPQLGLGSLKRLLLESRKHFKRAMFNCDDGFSMHTETLKGQAHGSLDAVFGKKNLDLIEWASSGLGACEVDKITQCHEFQIRTITLS